MAYKGELTGEPTGDSEFGFGKGMRPHPDSDFQSGTQVERIYGRNGTNSFGNEAHVAQFLAEHRRDPRKADGLSGNDLLFVEGNVDRFGPGPAFVQEKAKRNTGGNPPATYPSGTPRQG